MFCKIEAFESKAGLFLLFLIVCAGSIVWSAEKEPFLTESASILSYDSIVLATDIHRPNSDGKFPAIILRGPYGSRGFAWLGKSLASSGYVFVAQNVRGTGGSGGSFFPFVHEKYDGMATLEWVLDQPWCDGRIGLWGTSYLGYCAYEIASSKHSAVKSMFEISSWSDLSPFFAHGGAFHLMSHLRWFYVYGSGQPAPPQEAWNDIFRTVPISQFFGGAEAMDRFHGEPYDFTALNIPIMHITGWYDYIYVNVLETYNAIKAASDKPPRQPLIIGPWSHNDVLNNVTRVGEVEFGEAAGSGKKWVMRLTRQWFDQTIKGIGDNFDRTPPVRVFIMGDNDWMEFESWPPEKADYQVWYIDSRGEANGSSGSGILTRQINSTTETDTFIFDPENPVPTTGGSNSNFFPENLGPRDQAEVEKREDILIYTSEALSEDFKIVGPIKAVVYASTEGKDTDFTAKLAVVHEDGYVRNIEDGIVRGRYLYPAEEGGQFLTPGMVYRFEINCGATALKVHSGEKLRLEISSSNFPKYDRNPNTGVDPLNATEFMAVKQTVYHTREYPSHIIIPILSE